MDLEQDQLFKQLSESEGKRFQSEYNRVAKNARVGFYLTLFLGAFGAHHFYLRRRGLGSMYLLLSWTFVPLIFSLIELSSIKLHVKKFNQAVAANIANKIKAERSSAISASESTLKAQA